MSSLVPVGAVDPLEQLLESDPLAQAEEEGLAQVREAGRDMVNYLFMALRTLALHDEDNEAVSGPIGRFRDAQDALIDRLERVHLIAVEGQMYVNDLRLKFKAAAYSNLRFVTQVFTRHNIGGVVIGQKLDEQQLKSFFLLLLGKHGGKGDGGDPFQSLHDALSALELPDLKIERPYAFKPAGFVEDPNRDEPGRRAAAAWVSSSLATGRYFDAIGAGEQQGALRVRKAVNELVDVCYEAPSVFLALHTVRHVGDPHVNHCVNVACLSLAVGRTLGLSKIELADLGVAALLHDLGYAELERQRSLEDHHLDAEKRRELHPVAAFAAMMRQGEYGTGLMRRLLVGLQHHMSHGGPGGFPALRGNNRSVFTRLVAVCDSYDALQWGSATQQGCSATEALERLQAAAGLAFDPVMVKALSGVIGRWPTGSVVRLSSGELAVVTSGSRSPERHAIPKVMVLQDSQGGDCEPACWDLAAAGEQRRITSALTPSEAGVLPHAVFFWMVLPDEGARTASPSTSLAAMGNERAPIFSGQASLVVPPAVDEELDFVVEEDADAEDEPTDPSARASLDSSAPPPGAAEAGDFFWMPSEEEPLAAAPPAPEGAVAARRPQAVGPLASPQRPTDTQELEGFSEARWRAYERALKQVEAEGGPEAAARLTWALWLEQQRRR